MIGTMRRARDGRNALDRPRQRRSANGILDTSDRQRPLANGAERLVVNRMHARSIRFDVRHRSAFGALGQRRHDESQLHRRQQQADETAESRKRTGHVHDTR